jgi:RNA polymerase sigma factor (sigma-70 family)
MRIGFRLNAISPTFPPVFFMPTSPTIDFHLQAIQAGDLDSREAVGRWLLEEVRSKVLQLSKRKYLPDSITSITDQVLVKFVRSGLLEKATNESYLHGAIFRAIQEIVVDTIRAQRRHKRKSPEQAIWSSLFPEFIDEPGIDDIALNDALSKLSQLNPRQHQIVMMRFFLKQKVSTIARELGLSRSTVEEHWRRARAWLFRELS